MWWSHSAVQFQQRYLFFLSYLCSCYRHWHWLFFVCVCIPRLNHKQIELANAEEKMLGIQKQWNVKFSQCISNSSSILLVYCDCCFFVSWLLSCKSWTPVILMLLTLTLASCVCVRFQKNLSSLNLTMPNSWWLAGLMIEWHTLCLAHCLELAKSGCSMEK